MKIDFLYLNEKDMISAGVLDAAKCVETMRETISLFGKKDFLLGGPKGDEHGLQVNFPARYWTSPFNSVLTICPKSV